MSEKKKKSKDIILSAAANIVAEKGIMELSLNSIAKSSGLSKSLIAYHYPKLDRIVADVFNQASTLGQKYTEVALQKAKSFEEQIYAIVIGAL